MTSDKSWSVALAGDYSDPETGLHRAVFSRLSADRCTATVRGPMPSAGSSVSLWIGAVGPFVAVVAKVANDALELRFDASLPRPVLRHFVALEVAL